MNQTSIHLHAYAGRENGLMVIGSVAALGELGQKNSISQQLRASNLLSELAA